MKQKLEPTNVFQIEFNTMPGGYLKTVQVPLENGVMDSIDVARIDLCDHPLYRALERYVKSNPSKKGGL